MGCGTWDGAAVFFQSRAQPIPGSLGPPCYMNVLSGDAVSADFHKEKIGQFSGGLGGKTPSGVFASFCRYELMLGQKDAAAHGIPFLQDCAFMRGQTAIPVFFRFGLSPNFRLSRPVTDRAFICRHKRQSAFPRGTRSTHPPPGSVPRRKWQSIFACTSPSAWSPSPFSHR